MKGYTNVSVADIESAMINWRAKYDQGEVIRDKGVELYYEKYYTKGRWYTRLISRKQSPKQFAADRIPFFQSWDSILGEFLTEDEVDNLKMTYWNRHKEQYIAVKALLRASEHGDILLDNELCWFVNEYKGEKQDV